MREEVGNLNLLQDNDFGEWSSSATVCLHWCSDASAVLGTRLIIIIILLIMILMKIKL